MAEQIKPRKVLRPPLGHRITREPAELAFVVPDDLTDGPEIYVFVGVNAQRNLQCTHFVMNAQQHVAVLLSVYGLNYTRGLTAASTLHGLKVIVSRA